MVCASAAWFSWRLLPRGWSVFVLTLMAALTFAVGASRIVLGVHYPSDVLAAIGIGSTLAAISLWLAPSATWFTV